MEKSLGYAPKELAEQPDFPEEFGYLWHWYLELKGSEALSFTEIKNWVELTSNNLQGWELDLIKTLDRLYWRYSRE